MSDTLRLPLSSSGKPPLEVALTMCRDAGRVLMEHFAAREGTARVKGRGNVVTEADVAAERLIIERLREEFPEHAILAEESGAETRAEDTPWLWVVDPLDGTRNFSRGIPHFAVNVALCYGIEPVVGVTFDPVRNERFWAVRGRGAHLNDGALRASSAASVAESVLGLDLGYDDDRARAMLDAVQDIFPGVDSVRVMGSGALGVAYAAAGRFDLYVHHLLYPWDLAPGILLVREAGGTITSRDGGEVTIHSEGIAAGAPGAHADFLRQTEGRPWRSDAAVGEGMEGGAQ